ncbi:LacI family DNA-binding transcriptional regulator [Paracoccus sp. (in: a-proteobacteria)]|uniref:LacI family DNA-binding transcriptional regulator n=1 Tax=Paracoccus sp. TaxID=267 RepID=UPI003A8B56DB
MNIRAVRIQDVANVAGVSTATVSRALSNPELLSEATRRTVMEAIRTTGYRVNRAARNLRKQRAGAVLVLVPNLGNPFFSQILAGLSQGFSDNEYSVLILDTDHLQDDRGILDYFLDSRIDGMITLDGRLSLRTLELLTANSVADRVVCACEWVAGAELPSVRSDNARGVELAIRHLHGLGHRRIAHVTGPEGNVLTHARREAFRAMCADLDLPIRDDWIIRGDFSMQSGRMAAGHILSLPARDRPTAVFCAADGTAFGLIAGLAAAGLRIPQDMSVVGFDDIGLAEHYIPALTTIRQDRLALGRQAAGLLKSRLSGADDAPAGPVRLVDVELIVRASTAR